MTFVRGLLAGKTGIDAYRAAYSCEHWTANAIMVEASRLRVHPKISLWLSAARQAHLGTAILTREAHLAELERLKELALASGNLGAAIVAEQTRGKVAGHHVEQVRDVTQYDPAHTLNEIASASPELAQMLAQQHGIDWDHKSTRH